MDLNGSKKILSPAAVPPSRTDFEVIGTFNPGVAVHAGKVKLLVRVAEAVRRRPPTRSTTAPETGRKHQSA